MKNTVWNYLPTFLLGLIFVLSGVVMISNNLYGIGIRIQYSSYSAIDGYLVIFVGIIFLVVTYFSLSPFSKIRMFFERGGTKKRKKTSKP